MSTFDYNEFLFDLFQSLFEELHLFENENLLQVKKIKHFV